MGLVQLVLDPTLEDAAVERAQALLETSSYKAIWLLVTVTPFLQRLSLEQP